MVITILLLLILTGVVINAIMGDRGIINITISTVEKSNIATGKEQIELTIIELKAKEEKEITIDKIIDDLVNKGITTEEDSNKYSGQVKNEQGYIYEITEEANGEWKVEYIYKGEIDKTPPTVSVIAETDTITEGDSKEVSAYFTASSNGNATITLTYTINGEEISNTNTLAAGTHIITCTVIKSNGLSATASITVIVNTKKVDYTEQSWTTAGTYTWTCPEGVTRVRVAVCGGGGGGVMGTDFVSVEEGGSGGTSKFGELIEATGAIGLKVTVIYSGGRVSQWKHEGYTPGSPNGNKGASTSSRNYVGGGKGFALSFEKANGEYGQGGRARGYYSGDGPQDYSWSGHSGGYNTNYFDVIPGNSYEIIVGEGGEPCELGKTSGYAESGTSGFVFIAYGGDI